MTVAGDARLVAQGLELPRELLLLFLEAVVQVAHQRSGIDEHLAVVAVDDHGQVLDAGGGHVDGAHDGGDAERVRQDGAVGVA